MSWETPPNLSSKNPKVPKIYLSGTIKRFLKMKLEITKKDWDEYLQVKGLAKKTREEYNNYFDKIDKQDFNQNEVIRFLHNYNNTIARATIKNLIQYLKIMKYVIDIEIPKITGRKRKRIIDVLNEEEIKQLAYGMKTKRSKYMVLLSFYGGLRISELTGEEYAIKPFDFNWNAWIKEPKNNGILKITGKGNKQRNVFIPQWLMAEMFQWIKNDISKKQNREDKLFQIGERRWKKILSEEAIRILGKHINPHLLRHSCNQWLRSNGWDVTERQKYLGHEHPTTTMIYDHTNPEDLKKKFGELF